MYLSELEKLSYLKQKKKTLTHFKNIHVHTPNKNAKEEGTVTQRKGKYSGTYVTIDPVGLRGPRVSLQGG